MKTLFTAFCNFMDRLGESNHFLRCAWIFTCVAINAALGGLIGKGIGTLLSVVVTTPTIVHTSMLYGMVGMGGIVLLGMVVAYKHLWAMSDPSLRCVENTPPQREEISAARLQVRDVPMPVK